MNKTGDQIKKEGLLALRERLGRAGMVRFLHQFGNGSGDYATERRKWADSTSMESLVSPQKKKRKRK